MKAREVLLKHLNKDASETMKRIHEIANYDSYLEAMEEYADLRTEKCKEVLLENLWEVKYLNGYPIEAVPKAVILMLNKLIK